MEHLQTHISELTKSMGVNTVQKPFMAGMMYVEYEPPKIEGPTIKKQSDYFTMLHELGHVFHGHTQGRPPYTDKTYYFDHGVLRSEAEAWDWALDISLEVPNLSTRSFMWDTCLGSYYRHSKLLRGKPTRLRNGNRAWVEFVFDTPDRYFFTVKERILG